MTCMLQLPPSPPLLQRPFSLPLPPTTNTYCSTTTTTHGLAMFDTGIPGARVAFIVKARFRALVIRLFTSIYSHFQETSEQVHLLFDAVSLATDVSGKGRCQDDDGTVEVRSCSDADDAKRRGQGSKLTNHHNNL